MKGYGLTEAAGLYQRIELFDNAKALRVLCILIVPLIVKIFLNDFVDDLVDPVCPAAFICFFLHFPVRIQKTFPVDFLSLRDDHKRSGIDIIDDLLRFVELLSVQNTDHGLSVLFPISSFTL